MREPIRESFVRRFIRQRVFLSGERDQAVLRLIISISIAVYSLAWVSRQYAPEKFLASPAFLIPMGFLLFSATMYGIAKTLPDENRGNRHLHISYRLLAICGDIGVISWGMSVTGAHGAPWYFIYLWVTFGNGIRYGSAYLYATMGISLIGFSFVLSRNPYWQENIGLGIGLLFALLLLPLYVGILVTKLHKALSAAEEATQSRARFIARMSHEFRTPLNSIIGVSDLMREEQLSGNLHQMVNIIRTSAENQLTLVNQILDTAKYESGSEGIERSAFDLHRLSHDVLSLVWPQAAEKDLEVTSFIDATIPFRLIGSPDQLKQVLTNLLANAVKFTDRGHVSLRITKESLTDHQVTVRMEISDSGIGMKDDAREKIFEPFAQADETITRRFGGTGLGTTIARHLVGLMGGTLECDSAFGVGTTFSVLVPFDIDMGGVGEWSEHGRLRLLAMTANRLDRLCGDDRLDIDYCPDPESAARQISEKSPAYDAIVIDTDLAGRPCPKIVTMLRGSGVDAPIIGHCNSGLPEGVHESGLQILVSAADTRQWRNALHLVSVVKSGRENTERAPTRAPTRSLAVLVADDQPSNREVARMILERAGHRVDTVEDGEQALEMLEQIRYDIALIDMHMPKMSGIEMGQIYRFANLKDAVPLVLLTADATGKAREQCSEAGFDKLLLKPIRPADLLETVHEMTGVLPKEVDSANIATISRPPKPLDTREDELLSEEVLADLQRIDPEDSGFLEDVLNGAMRDIERLMVQITESRARGDVAGLADHAHALKGVALSVGAIRLGNLGDHLHKMELRDLERLDAEFFGQLESISRQSLALLEAWLSPEGNRTDNRRAV